MKKALLLCCALFFSLHTSYAQSTNRVKIISINPSEDTGQDYSSWLTDNLDSLVESAWTNNAKWVDVRLTLEHRSTISKLSFYDYTGVFTEHPAQIYALKDTTLTFLGLFDGSTYDNFVDLNLTNPVIADAIVIRKFGNDIPQKIKIFGETTPNGSPLNRLRYFAITPNINTGQDYSPWLSDSLDVLVESSWSSSNSVWVDIKLTLEFKSVISKLSFFDYTGVFTDRPASIYALNDTTKTFLGLFDGSTYNSFVDLNLANPVVADAIIVRKYGNNVPQKVNVYGNPVNGAAKAIVTGSTTNPNTPTTTTGPTIVGTKIPIAPKRWYQLNHVGYGLDALFDGNTENEVFTGWGKILDNYDCYYPLKEGEVINIQSVKFYDGSGTLTNEPFKLYGITDQWERVLIATFTGSTYNQWVGPNPSDINNFVLANPSTANFRYLLINCYGGFPREMELYGTYTASTVAQTSPPLKNIKMKDAFGINSFEWDFLKATDASLIDENKAQTFKAFTGFRQYMDWEKIEHYENVYTYNPCFNGGWNYDAIYERCKQDGIEVLPCLQGVPYWFFNTYPDSSYHDGQIVPARYGYSYSDPNAYRDQAQVAFQYVARYGSNTNVDTALLSVFDQPRWTSDSPNVLKVGLNVIKYIECGNERDKWWKGRKGYQTAREYAANLSAFYDGHKNTMGAGIGVKNADPNIKVVMAGLASADPDYVRGMIDWCKEFRGYKPDGKVNLCWDVINYHLYSDNANSSQSGSSTRAAAPEVSSALNTAKKFVQLAHDEAYDMPVWITELGFDLNQNSPLKAIPIGNKSALITQADWGLRSALMYNRLGLERSFFYMLYDSDLSNATQFASSGLVDSLRQRRPIADYLYQTKNLIGDYVYKETISQDPLVDRYELNGKSAYALMIPDEIGRTGNYTLSLNNVNDIKIYSPKAGSEKMDSLSVTDNTHNFHIAVTETPIFVIPGQSVDNNNQNYQANSSFNTSILSAGNNYVSSSSKDYNSTILLNKVTTERNMVSIVYPNPASDILYIATSILSKVNHVKLQNMSGITVIESNAISAEGISIKDLPSGNYLLSVDLNDGKIEYHKVTIVR